MLKAILGGVVGAISALTIIVACDKVRYRDKGES